MITALLASLKVSWRWWLAIGAVVAVAGTITTLAVLLANSHADLNESQSDNRVLASDNALQGQVIATQALNFNRFNQIAEYTNRNNSLIDASTDKTVTEYREILKIEKTCALPVPVDVSGGLLEYANRLRAGAVYADTDRPDESGINAATTGTLTYCQAVLWIKPLLATIEKANNQLAAIRQIEQDRR